MTGNDRLVSIIMPAFNAAEYLSEAVESVIRQTWKQWELIIINDGSTDNTGDILDNYTDPRITIINQGNLGVGAARNVGLALASGEYVTFLDADDVLPPKSLEIRADFLCANNEIDIVDGQVLTKDKNLNRVQRVYRPYYTGLLLPRLLALDDRVFFGTNYMVRKEALVNMRFTENMSHAEDLLFFTLLAAKKQLRYSYVDAEIYYCRANPRSAMSNLVGLEEGYLRFMRSVFAALSLNTRQKLYLKLRISKIMFLTWIREGNYVSAITSVYRCIFRT